ncbi:tetratricopeptide repeat protein [Pedobacter sp. BS3]|uniref:type IX secretion system periplasmic lipoprotein PorW/SprE n=1 Tax=Pedobacter sp. BS3 TaxID=2567937 RepID=UPI0011ECACC2|nr:tetratricopeptide repeat protein [Pedobacter sp. BS3]TZF81283.1 tetratricopeptide repeat protein [Pedobacter sp. BS3]
MAIKNYYGYRSLKTIIYGLVLLLVSACASNKDTVTSRGMQNLTARYNILFNAKELLRQSRENIEQNQPVDYDHLLSVYVEPNETSAQAESTNLDSVIIKANAIINDKAHSNYVDDAYLLIGKANYYKANYFNAAEFFKYVSVTYPQNKPLCAEAWGWEARSLLQLKKPDEASAYLDSALNYVQTAKKLKKSIAVAIYATQAQFDIRTGNQEHAITMLEKALKAGTSKYYRIRWHYLLAQLQENNGMNEQAYANYGKVVKSNASFEMAFNAMLNQINLENDGTGNDENRIKRLRSLLKEDKNADFKDQIYFRIADTYLKGKSTDDAIENFNLAIRNSTKNQNQKGLAYYRLAEIYFKNGVYTKAKAYYDSTLTSLKPTYPGYDLIKLKSKNLDLLAKRFEIIAEEDSLQSIARLPEAQRDLRIGQLVREQLDKATGETPETPGPFLAGIDAPDNNKTITEGKFYFNNTGAISQGFSDFKRRWGNRKLEDNWRRSEKTAPEIPLNEKTLSDVNEARANSTPQPDEASLRKKYLDALPLTDEQMQKSNQKIIDAYYDVANFYKDELKDKQEAIETYLILLKRFPDNTYKPAIYYNLYRLYSDTDPAKADEYKNLLLKQFPESVYAKVIADPDYLQKRDEKAMALLGAYNTIYDLYLQKQYGNVLASIAQTEQQFGQNQFSAQLDYLKALAIGHTSKLPAFEESMKKIVFTYPADKLVTPLVKENLTYINKNREAMSKRVTALVDFDPNEPPYIEEPRPLNKPTPPVLAANPPAKQAEAKPAVQEKPKTAEPKATEPDKKPVAEEPEKAAEPVTKPAGKEPVAEKAPVTATEPVIAKESATTQPQTMPKKVDYPFHLTNEAEYYFVINIADATLNLSPSRFGIGQFNRSNYAGMGISHQLKSATENQLIYVGPFRNLEAVKDYEHKILPLIPEIMKVPAEKYNTFVVSKTDLDKLADRKMIDLYIDFYKQQ